MPDEKSRQVDPGWAELARARNGDGGAWRTLFDTHSPALHRMAALITGSADAARDCVQETFVRALGSAVHHTEGTLKAYLSTITYRLALKEAMRLKRRAPLGDSTPYSPEPSPLEDLMIAERRRETVRVLMSLPARQRQVLVLRLHGNRSYEEIAAMLDLPIGTVKSRIFHAVKTARTEMKKRGLS